MRKLNNRRKMELMMRQDMMLQEMHQDLQYAVKLMQHMNLALA